MLTTRKLTNTGDFCSSEYNSSNAYNLNFNSNGNLNLNNNNKTNTFYVRPFFAYQNKLAINRISKSE